MKLIFHRCQIIFGIWFFLLFSYSSFGQPQKKQLTEADYGKWGTLWIKGFSNSGKWVNFEMSYENHKDTLFLQNTERDLRLIFPNGFNGKFGNEKFFICMLPDGRLNFTDLETMQSNIIDKVDRYEIGQDAKNIITFEKKENGKSAILIRNPKGLVINIINEVYDFTIDPSKKALLYISKIGECNSLWILDLITGNKLLIQNTLAEKLTQAVWQDNGKSVAFIQETNPSEKIKQVCLYNIDGKKFFTYDIQNRFLSDGIGGIYDGQSISISNDGKRVFFMATKNVHTVPITENSQVEIWEGTDQQLFPSKQLEASYGEWPKLACWFPENKNGSFVSTNDLPDVIMSPNQDYALLSNQFQYGIEPKYYDEVDYILKDIRTGTVREILTKQSHDPNQIGFSPSGNQIIYYKENNWWLYDILKDSHLNITKNIKTKWDNRNNNAPHQFDVYGNPGWSIDGKMVLLYDEYDIWQVSLDGRIWNKLTEGKKLDISFRIDRSEYKQSSSNNFDGRAPMVFDLLKDILLVGKKRSDHSTGYFVFTIKSGTQQLVFDQKKIGNIHKSQNNYYIYTKESFDQSPMLMLLDWKTGKENLLFESNIQQKNYYYGKSDLIYYENKKGEKLKGALFYPANYDQSKHYPMVVYIYDTMSVHVYDYQNPTTLNSDGFNITNFTLNGYFVLLPDINYELGNPAMSAVECVNASVNAVIKTGIVDSNKIGLIGHSFGGYETNFIITQSNLFAAAISGAGVSDSVGYYFTLGTNNNIRPEMWRFESQQWRMGKSFFDDKNGYLRNSPIMFADKINIPVLLWAGKLDRVVDTRQSVTFYLALRRLGVTTRLLVYPNENHTLERMANQMDLSKRVEEWFRQYLKD